MFTQFLFIPTELTVSEVHVHARTCHFIHHRCGYHLRDVFLPARESPRFWNVSIFFRPRTGYDANTIHHRMDEVIDSIIVYTINNGTLTWLVLVYVFVNV
jgi:hypothetical protein